MFLVIWRHQTSSLHSSLQERLPGAVSNLSHSDGAHHVASELNCLCCPLRLALHRSSWLLGLEAVTDFDVCIVPMYNTSCLSKINLICHSAAQLPHDFKQN